MSGVIISNASYIKEINNGGLKKMLVFNIRNF